MKNTVLVALGGILTALSVVIMFLSVIFPFLELFVPTLSGSLLLVFIVERKYKWSILVYISVSLLSFMLISNKEAVLMYIFFFGYYLMFKMAIENKFKKSIRVLLKILLFNITMIASNCILIYVFNIPFKEIETYGLYGVMALLLMGNIFFVVYDYALTTVIRIYNRRYRKVFKKIFK